MDRQMKKILFLLIVAVLAVVFVAPVLATTITMPAGETHYATFITTISATLNGYVSDEGGEPCDVRFQYYYGSGTWTDNETPWIADYVTGDNPTVDISGLTTGELYYYRVQIKNSAGTFSGSSTTFTAYDAPSMPSTWFSTPDITRFRHTFFYGLYNFVADEMKMPRPTFYMLATLFLCVVLGIVALILGKRLMPAVIVLTGSMVLFSLLRLLPMFFIAFSIVAIWGMIKMGHPREE
jgi:hypothetical protein